MSYIGEFIRTADYLQRMESGDIVTQFSHITTREFSQHTGDSPVPVVICGYNEERDLPAALLTLASSSADVLPIVVDNDSNDRTAEFASKMGAIVLTEKTPGKTAALETGIDWVVEETGSSIILATDADSLVNPYWASYMSAFTRARVAPEVGGVVFGRVLVRYGESSTTDTVRSLFLNGRQHAFRALGRRPGARGSNTALLLNETVLSGIRSIPKTQEVDVVQDITLRDAVRENGGDALYAPSRKGTVITRGDRFSSMTDLFHAIGSRMKRKSSYAANYPNLYKTEI